ncbi:T3SS effector HopA1 family protein [Brevibacillus halotolerans]|uniref:T3SS effector HopA1 family protein n=1 Tax=Brevibacillus halotolerans TaxID=1507437 RepID=UPI0015EECCFD|nr:hypothetical protein [Brevibacillus halotolerans]
MQLPLRFPKEFPSISPGFYIALSNQVFFSENSQTLVRIYFNINPKGAIHLMQMATSMLNAENIPFKLKVSARCTLLGMEPLESGLDGQIEVACMGKLQI